jgi:RNase P subunit RPR2
MNKEKIKEETSKLLEKAINLPSPNHEISKKLIKKARRMCLHNHLKIPEKYKDKFCKKCFTIFNTNNSKIRIKNGFKILTCLNCNYIRRKKI